LHNLLLALTKLQRYSIEYDAYVNVRNYDRIAQYDEDRR